MDVGDILAPAARGDEPAVVPAAQSTWRGHPDLSACVLPDAGHGAAEKPVAAVSVTVLVPWSTDATVAIARAGAVAAVEVVLGIKPQAVAGAGAASAAGPPVVAGLIAFEKLIPSRRVATYGTAGVLLVLGILMLVAPAVIPALTVPDTGSMSPMSPMNP